MLLLEPSTSESLEKSLPSDVETLEFLNGDFRIPDKTTFYHCTTHRIPERLLGKKHHMIKYEPSITPGNEKLVHHIVLNHCSGQVATKLAGEKFTCFDKDTLWGKIFRSCSSTVVAWAIGGQAFHFPSDVGFSVGAEGDPIVFFMETHYDNVDLRKTGSLDNSGLRLTVTSQVREHDMGVLLVGTNFHRGTSQPIIPPHLDQMLSAGYCSSECLDSSLKTQTMNVFGVLLHSHLMGTGMRARVVRQGRELAPLARDENYDFDFQEVRQLREEYVLKPGDSIITECSYTGPRNFTTLGGYSTMEEMCVAFIMYYPKSSLTVCFSEINYSLPEMYNSTVDWVKSLDWTVKNNIDMFVEHTKEDPVTVTCIEDNVYSPIMAKQYTQVELQPNRTYVPPKQCP